MTKKLMELGKRKKKEKEKEKWHDAFGDSSTAGAKVWPALAVEDIDNANIDGKGDGGKTEVRARSKPQNERQLSYALANVVIGITFAEAVQNSSTIYGVRVARRTARFRA